MLRGEADSAFKQPLALDPRCYEANQLYGEFLRHQARLRAAAKHSGLRLKLFKAQAAAGDIPAAKSIDTQMALALIEHRCHSR